MMTEKMYCNACGRPIKGDHNIQTEETLSVKKEWGYFSKKDLQIHEFTLCEDCYDKMIEKFKIPVSVKDKTEALS